MRLAVSNIAWSAEDDLATYELLRRAGVPGLEVAPTRIWPGWKGANPANARRLARQLADEGLAVPAFQAVTYGLPELQVLGSRASRTALVDHLERVADLAAELGAGVLVFGAPKNRLRGDLDVDRAFELAVETFREAGDRCTPRGVTLCIEPNPEEYGCDFVNRSPEALRLVEAVDSPGFGLHLDAAGIHLAGEDPAVALPPAAARLRHFHASEPWLGSFAEPEVDHAAMARALTAIDYDGWVSIEMRPTETALDSVAEAVRTVSRLYGPVARRDDA